MRRLSRYTVAAIVLVVGLALGAGSLAQPTQSPSAQPPSSQPAPAPDREALAPQPVDPRVQIRSYRFEGTDAEIPYALFVSSKVRPNRKAPLVIALHGLCGTHTSLLRGNALDLAEERGYVLVGPMGYNQRGWYGVPVGTGPRGAPPPRQNRPPPSPRFAACFEGEDPPNLREMSEQDVLNVLDLIRDELKIDDRRTYLMGHSMGGAGTFHLAVKYPDTWAAIAAIAPAAFGLEPASIATIPDMPVALVHGDMDTAVPVAISRSWVDVLKAHGMAYEYLEVAGGDHGNVITLGMPTIFDFFDAHSK
jgi:predicted peptidase